MTRAPAAAGQRRDEIEIGADAAAPQLGEKLLLVPGHCDPTVNLLCWFSWTPTAAR